MAEFLQISRISQENYLFSVGEVNFQEFPIVRSKLQDFPGVRSEFQEFSRTPEILEACRDPVNLKRRSAS